MCSSDLSVGSEVPGIANNTVAWYCIATMLLHSSNE